MRKVNPMPSTNRIVNAPPAIEGRVLSARADGNMIVLEVAVMRGNAALIRLDGSVQLLIPEVPNAQS